MRAGHPIIKVLVVLCYFFPLFICPFSNPGEILRLVHWNQARQTPRTIQIDAAWFVGTPGKTPTKEQSENFSWNRHIPVTGKRIDWNPTPVFNLTLTPKSNPVHFTQIPSASPTRTLTPTPSKTIPAARRTKSTPTRTPGIFSGKLTLTEVLYDPLFQDSGLEWVELFNEEVSTIALAYLRLGDEETKGGGEGMYQFPMNAVMAGKTTIVVAKNGAIFYQYYGVYPSYEILNSLPEIPDMIKVSSWSSGSFALSNTGDEVILMDGTNRIIDSVAWGVEPVSTKGIFPCVQSGHSLHRVSASSNLETTSEWFELNNPNPFKEIYAIIPSETPTETEIKPAASKPTKTPAFTRTPTATGTSTPTQMPTPTQTWTPTQTETPTVTLTPLASAGRILISEVMINPNGLDHWVEIYNSDSFPIDLSGKKIGDAQIRTQNEGMFRFPPPGSAIFPSQIITIAVRGDEFMSATLQKPDFEIMNTRPEIPDMLAYSDWFLYPTEYIQLRLLADQDEIILLNDEDEYLDAVAWGNSLFFADNESSVFRNPAVPIIAPGHSLERFPIDQDTHSRDDWRDQEHPSPGKRPDNPTREEGSGE